MTVPQNRPGVDYALGNHEERIRALEFSPGGGGGTAVCGPWITVGTPGVDGVDALIAANPAPYNAPPYVPFTSPFTQALGANAPVQFMTDGCFVYIRGAPAVGTVGNEVFVLPTGYRPAYQQPIIAANGDGITSSGEAFLCVFPTGSVVWERVES